MNSRSQNSKDRGGILPVGLVAGEKQRQESRLRGATRFLVRLIAIGTLAFAVLSSFSAKAALAQTVGLVSVNSANSGTGNGGSGFVSTGQFLAISGNGRYVAFQSAAKDLLPGMTTNCASCNDIYWRDLLTGTTKLVSVNTAGNSAGLANARAPVISADGRYVFFESNAGDLTTIPDSNLVNDVFVRDTLLNVTRLVSVNGLGTASGNLQSGGFTTNNNVNRVSISPDGRFVAFSSRASDLVTNDTNGLQDVFRRDLVTSITSLVSINAAGSFSSNGQSANAVISADGRVVAFESMATDLVAIPRANAGFDIFARNMPTGITQLVTINRLASASGNQPDTVIGFGLDISADGKFVAFPSNASDLVPGDTNGATDAFRRNLTTGATELVSINSLGTGPGNGASGIATADYSELPMSADGRFICFTSAATNLTTISDTNFRNDVFVRDMTTGTTQMVSVNSTAASSGNFDSSNSVISANGRFVAFESSATDLVSIPGDTFRVNIFVRDLLTGITTMISHNISSTHGGNGLSRVPAIADEESFVAFTSTATDLVTLLDSNGASDVFASPGVFAPGAFRFTGLPYIVAEDGVSEPVTVTRTGGSNGRVKVDFATADGTATQRGDYTTVIRTLEFAPGETSKVISIPIIDDSYAEPGETFTVNLSNPTGGASLGSPSSAMVTINDNELISGPNPIDGTGFFVRQHYLDFLNREPDASGLAFWSDQINSCGADVQCIGVKRINVSAAFYLSIEFQETGYLVYRIYKTSFDNLPGLPVPVRFNEFLPDTQRIGQGVMVNVGNWQTQLEDNKNAFAEEFVLRPRFIAAFPQTLTPTQFVDGLNQNAGLVLSTAERQLLVNDLTTGAKTRGQVLRAIAENQTLKTAEFNKAFVLMQYFGYLRRNPNDSPDVDFSGFDFWLAKLNQFNGNFASAEMVKAFISSSEYRQRFGP